MMRPGVPIRISTGLIKLAFLLFVGLAAVADREFEWQFRQQGFGILVYLYRQFPGWRHDQYARLSGSRWRFI